jgi:hypothetical protein
MPYFLRRAWCLFEARRALFEGAPERALDHLRDPTLTLSTKADHLRRRAFQVLYRSAARRAQEGRDASVARLLQVVAGEDPDQAREWQQRLSHVPEVPREPPPSADLRELLARMRSAPSPASGARFEPTPLPRPPSGPARLPDARRFQLAIDDGGEFLVVTGNAVTLGHARAGLADVPFLGDLESLHARLVRSESFHGGPRWQVEALSGRRVAVEGRRVEGEPQDLADGDEVRLGRGLAFVFRVPEAGSASVLLELAGGVETEGAQRVLLFAAGVAGRVRIGAHGARHVPIAGLEHEVSMWLEGDELRVTCAGGLKVFDEFGTPSTASEEVRVPCPPPRRIDVAAGARPSQRVPFGFSISPLAGPAEVRP